MLFDRETVKISHLLSQYNGRQITLSGGVTRLNTDRPIYDISVKANNIPLDSTLMAALPDRQKRFYNQFSPAGLADAEVKIFTPQQSKEPATFIADLSFKKTSLAIPLLQKSHEAPPHDAPRKTQSLEANQFQLPLSDISAKAVFTPDLIRIKNLTGRYGRALVSLTGRIRPGNEHSPSSYSLSLHADQVELNDDLIAFLPVSVKKSVSELQLTGKINFTADLNKTESDDSPDYKLIINCLGNNMSSPFYPLKDVTGSLTITKDNITLKDITAVAADTTRQTADTPTIKINGRIALANNAFSRGWFRLSANDLFFDEQLGLALPEGIQPFYRRLSPAGRFDLNLENIKIFNTDSGEKYVDLAATV